MGDHGPGRRGRASGGSTQDSHNSSLGPHNGKGNRGSNGPVSTDAVTGGAVKVYATGPLTIAGNGVATAGNRPPNLLIYGTADPARAGNKTTSVSMAGSTTGYKRSFWNEAHL